MSNNDKYQANTDPDSSLDAAKDALKEESLKVAGYAYLLGDAALYAAGVASGRKKEADAGLLWAAGGLVLARYGKPKTERQLARLSERLNQHFKENNITVPDGSDLSVENKKRTGGVIEKVEDFLYDNPSQVLNALYAVGGLQLVRSGVQHHKKWDAASGALVAAGALAGLIIPEPKDEPDTRKPDANKGAIGKAIDWVKEKPLRTAGYLYTMNNATMLVSALGERRANPQDKSYMFKLLNVASYVVGNSLLSISSKDHTKQAGSEEGRLLPQLEQAAAQVIAAQPKEVQHAIIAQTAGYLAGQDEIKNTAMDIDRDLHQRVAELAASPESPSHNATQHSWQQRVAQNSSSSQPNL